MEGNEPFPGKQSAIAPQKYKIVFLGNQSVGKTSIIHRFISDQFNSDYTVIATLF